MAKFSVITLVSVLLNLAMRALVIVMVLFIAALAMAGLDVWLSPPHPAAICPPPQGNKVSLPDPLLTCVKTRKGKWVCFEGGRDV